MSRQVHGLRPSCGRGLLGGLAAVALTLLLSAAPRPAAAMMVTSPNLATLVKGAPVQVTWLSNYPSYAVDIELQQVTPYVFNPRTVLATNITNTNQAVVNLPASASCDPAYLYELFVTSHQGGKTGDANISRAFRLTCGGREEPLTVVKQIINNNPGAPTPPGPFQVQVDCRPNGPHTVVTLTSPNDLQQVVAVPVGSSCSIVELTPPPPPKPCKWVTTYPTGGPKSAVGITRTVVNELKCGGGTSTFTVAKRIINNNPGVPTQAGPYQVKVDCSPNGPHVTVGLTSPNNLQQVVQVPAGSVCAIVELPPPPPPKGCEWNVSYPGGQQARAGGSLAVVNELKCGHRTGPDRSSTGVADAPQSRKGEPTGRK